MANALKLVRLDSSYLEHDVFSFSEQEVMRTLVRPVQPNTFSRNLSNDPFQNIQGDVWHEIDVTFRIHDEETIEMFVDMITELYSQTIFRLYPALTAQPSLKFDVLWQPEEMLLGNFASGLYKSGDLINVTFLECHRISGAVIEDDLFG